MDDIIGYIFMGIFCIIFFILVIAGIDAIFDIISGDFHIYNYVDMSSTTQYRTDAYFQVSDKREEFAGSFVSHYQDDNKMLFTLADSGKDPYNFKDTSFYVLDKDWRMYKLQVLATQSTDFGDGSFILNPKSNLYISCELPAGFLNSNSKIMGFKISGRGVNIRFGYLPRPYWKSFYEEKLKPLIQKFNK